MLVRALTVFLQKYFPHFLEAAVFESDSFPDAQLPDAQLPNEHFRILEMVRLFSFSVAEGEIEFEYYYHRIIFLS